MKVVSCHLLAVCSLVLFLSGAGGFTSPPTMIRGQKLPFGFVRATNNNIDDHDEVDDDDVVSMTSRRGVVWKIPLAAVASYGYGKLVYNAFMTQGLRYPPEHEARVESTIRQSLSLSSSSSSSSGDGRRPAHQLVRVLEVGAGKDLRLLRRGLCKSSLEMLASRGVVQRLEWTAVDLLSPESEDVVKDAERHLQEESGTSTAMNNGGATTLAMETQLNAMKGDITKRLDRFADGYFDSILCCLTLCSVTNQEGALREMRRLLRPQGGTFGYVEHVAVNPDEPYRFLEWQQTVLDPLQRKLADNCHLHRYTEDAISSVFDVDTCSTASSSSTAAGSGKKARLEYHERFLVDAMWPVTCQCCGVVQRLA